MGSTPEKSVGTPNESVQKLVRDYYTIRLDSEMVEAVAGPPFQPDGWQKHEWGDGSARALRHQQLEKTACDLAIDEARERAKLYCIPCTWEATILQDGWYSGGEYVVRVKRTRFKVPS